MEHFLEQWHTTIKWVELWAWSVTEGYDGLMKPKVMAREMNGDSECIVCVMYVLSTLFKLVSR